MASFVREIEILGNSHRHKIVWKTNIEGIEQALVTSFNTAVRTIAAKAVVRFRKSETAVLQGSDFLIIINSSWE